MLSSNHPIVKLVYHAVEEWFYFGIAAEAPEGATKATIKAMEHLDKMIETANQITYEESEARLYERRSDLTDLQQQACERCHSNSAILDQMKNLGKILEANVMTRALVCQDRPGPDIAIPDPKAMLRARMANDLHAVDYQSQQEAIIWRQRQHPVITEMATSDEVAAILAKEAPDLLRALERIAAAEIDKPEFDMMAPARPENNLPGRIAEAVMADVTALEERGCLDRKLGHQGVETRRQVHAYMCTLPAPK